MTIPHGYIIHLFTMPHMKYQLVHGWGINPSEKSWTESQLGWLLPTEWKNKKCPKPPDGPADRSDTAWVSPIRRVCIQQWWHDIPINHANAVLSQMSLPFFLACFWMSKPRGNASMAMVPCPRSWLFLKPNAINHPQNSKSIGWYLYHPPFLVEQVYYWLYHSTPTCCDLWPTFGPSCFPMARNWRLPTRNWHWFDMERSGCSRRIMKCPLEKLVHWFDQPNDFKLRQVGQSTLTMPKNWKMKYCKPSWGWFHTKHCSHFLSMSFFRPGPLTSRIFFVGTTCLKFMEICTIQ